MPNIRVNWNELNGRELKTVTGIPFKVVRVSATHVAIRPRHGARDYALSIARELEPAVSAYAESRRLPIPADLQILGVREVLLSYAWGILQAVVIDRIGLRIVRQWRPGDFAGEWRITSLPEMGNAYAALGQPEPALSIQYLPGQTGFSGKFDIGLSSGSVAGDLREFGGESIVIFGFEGMDELEPVHGGGWLRLSDTDALEGEFIGGLGPFTAVRLKRPAASQRLPGRGARSPKPGAPGRGAQRFGKRGE